MNLLNDIFCLSQAKPLGYLPLSTIGDDTSLTIQECIEQAIAKGYSHYIVRDCQISSGALYTYHADYFNTIYGKYEYFLKEVNLSSNPRVFIEQISNNSYHFKDNAAVYVIIGLFFNDPRFRKVTFDEITALHERKLQYSHALGIH